MAKVFIVTRGDYSDYGIERVFSTRQLAEAYLDNRDDESRIEEYELDEPIKKENHIYSVSVNIATNETSCSISSCDFYKDCIEFNIGFSGEKRIIFYIESDSIERARKIATERFGAVVANAHITYPHLMEQIVERTYSYTYYKTYDYPKYNFYNGHVVLVFDDENIVDGCKDVIVERR